MKKHILGTVLALLTLTDFAKADLGKVGEVKGKVIVNRIWVEKREDGSFKYMTDTACKVDVKIPVYKSERQSPPSDTASEVKLPNMEGIDVKDLTVSVCKTSYKTGEPIELTLFASLSYLFEGKPEKAVEKVFSASSYYSVTPKKNARGRVAIFSTKDINLKNGSLILTADSYQEEDLLKETLFGVSIEFQE